MNSKGCKNYFIYILRRASFFAGLAFGEKESQHYDASIINVSLPSLGLVGWSFPTLTHLYYNTGSSCVGWRSAL